MKRSTSKPTLAGAAERVQQDPQVRFAAILAAVIGLSLGFVLGFVLSDAVKGEESTA